jgi:hypothetical protein
MNINSVVELYPSIDKLIGSDALMAIGGYASLVRQGILPEDRDAKDIDLCIFCGKKSIIGPENLFWTGSNMVDRWNYFSGVKDSLIGGYRYKMEFREKTSSSGMNSPEEYEEKKRLKMSIGIDKMASLRLMRTKIKEINEIQPVKSDRKGSWIDVNDWNIIARPFGSAVNGDVYFGRNEPSVPLQEMMQPELRGVRRTILQDPDVEEISVPESVRVATERMGVSGWTESIVSENDSEEINEELGGPTDDSILDDIWSNAPTFTDAAEARIKQMWADEMKKSWTYEEIKEKNVEEDEIAKKNTVLFEGFKTLHKPNDLIAFNRFFDTNDLKYVDFDLFFLDFSKFNKMTVLIDGIRYVHYYIILKAKYEYCLNKATNEESFLKHMTDLENSFKIKHIYGVNTPRDIEFLINNRINDAK